MSISAQQTVSKSTHIIFRAGEFYRDFPCQLLALGYIYWNFHSFYLVHHQREETIAAYQAPCKWGPLEDCCCCCCSHSCRLKSAYRGWNTTFSFPAVNFFGSSILCTLFVPLLLFYFLVSPSFACLVLDKGNGTRNKGQTRLSAGTFITESVAEQRIYRRETTRLSCRLP